MAKYSKAVVDRIVEALELGATHELASACGGIAYSTFKAWMNDKEAFLAAVQKAESKSALVALDRVRFAAQTGEWQAAAWLLERRHGYVKPSETVAAGGGLTLRIEWTREWRQGTQGTQGVDSTVVDLPRLELPEVSVA